MASTAFAEGQQAQLRGDFVRAAELFEIADQAVPSPAALRSAIRNREVAGQDVRAATLSLRAIERYGDDRETRSFAEGVLGRLSTKLARIRIRCDEPCTATADGGLVGTGTATSVEFFVAPGPHTLRAAWPGREAATRAVEAAAGQVIEIPFQAPAASLPARAEAEPGAPIARPIAEPPVAALGTSNEPTREPASGLSPAVFWVGAGLTAVAGGVLLWSGLDTLSARDDYEQNPTRTRYDDGVNLERRTNLLIGATAVLGIATAGIGLFATDWGGPTRVEVGLGASSATLSIAGNLP